MLKSVKSLHVPEKLVILPLLKGKEKTERFLPRFIKLKFLQDI